jgi:hypothetical protein
LAPKNPLPYRQLVKSVRVFHTGHERLRLGRSFGGARHRGRRRPS